MQIETPAIVVETVVIEAPIGAVFAALTEPEQLMQWWGSDDNYHLQKCVVDLRVGGDWNIDGGDTKDCGTFSVGGKYRIVDPPHLLEFTWCATSAADLGKHGDTVVRYELEEKNGVTHLRLTHSGFTTDAARERHHAGWITVLAWLRAYAGRSATA